MRNIIIFLFLLLTIGTVSAFQLTPIVRWNQTVSAGSTEYFDISIDGNETIIDTNVISIAGMEDRTCKEWITYTESRELPTTIPVKIAVPVNTVNGAYRCNIVWDMESTGMLSMSYAFPVTVKVVDGIEPTPTPVPTTIPLTTITTIPTTIPTTEPTPIPTTVKPTKTIPTHYPTTAPTTQQSGINAIHLLIAGIGFYMIGRKIP